MQVPPEKISRFGDLVLELNLQRQMFKDLFGGSDHLDVFQEAGVNFWSNLQIYLLDLLFLSVSRFFDPALSCGRANLSIPAIIELSDVAAIRDNLKKRESEMRRSWEVGIMHWRHKRISHTDLNTALQGNLLPDIPIASLYGLVDQISDFARYIHLSLYDHDVSYDIVTSRWVPQMLFYLKEGVEKHKNA